MVGDRLIDCCGKVSCVDLLSFYPDAVWCRRENTARYIINWLSVMEENVNAIPERIGNIRRL